MERERNLLYPIGDSFSAFRNFILQRHKMSELISFLKERRASTNLTQDKLAKKAGVGLRFVRDLEQGKATLRMDKVNQVLQLFGYELGPVPTNRAEVEETH